MKSNKRNAVAAQILALLTVLLQLYQIIFKKEVLMTDQQIELLIKIGAAIGGAIIAGIPTIIGWIKAKKAAKKAKTETEHQEAEAKMKEKAKELISQAEDTFKQVDRFMKQTGSTAGGLKKDTVMSKLQAFANTISFVFDEAYWSKFIDEEVKYTRTVNGRQ